MQSAIAPSATAVHSPGKAAPTGLTPLPMHFEVMASASLVSRLPILPRGSTCGGPRHVVTSSLLLLIALKLSFLHLRKTFHCSTKSLPANLITFFWHLPVLSPSVTTTWAPNKSCVT